MWNHIRSPPYIIPQNGKIIAPGFSSQLGIESQIVAILCKLNEIYLQKYVFDFINYNNFFIDGSCAFSVVTLIISVPKIEDKTKQRFGVYVINFYYSHLKICY